MKHTYHCDADGVVKLVHEDADDRRRQQQQDERIFELHRDTRLWTGLGTIDVSDLHPDNWMRTRGDMVEDMEDSKRQQCS